MGLAGGIVQKGGDVICPLDATGRFTEPVTDFCGMYVKDADKEIIKKLKEDDRLVSASQITHSYPFCWRSDTPLLYKAVPSWFMRVEQMQDLLLERNADTYWVPDSIKEGRFANWLRDARDWNLSRNRYWGTPIPVWISEDGEESVCIGSIEELAKLSGVLVEDLHRETVDKITIPSSRPGQPPLKRITEVFDCWFESGSMPYAQAHYPFENKKQFEDSFPADFIAEGTDQTRGWFYTLLVLSTALFNKAPFKNLIVNGLVLASDGQKMSKRLKNYPDPNELMDKYGADALRLFLINSPVVKAESLKFKEEGVRDILKDVFLPWYNAYRFLLQNIDTYQRETGQTFQWSESAYGNSENVMDKWIISFTQSLLVFVKKEMAAYHLYTVLPKLMKFIDNLTNWYVRTNRKRLKGEGNSREDCLAALETLFSVVFTMVRVFAPFTPFLTENMYQRLRKFAQGFDTDEFASVHYVMIPQPRLDLVNEDIERSVTRMQTVVELGRVVRDRKTMPIKYPLPELVLIHKDQQCLDDVKSFEKYVLEELNIKQLTLSTDKHQYGVELRAEPNHKTLGLRLKGAFKDVMKEIKSLNDEQVSEFLKTNKIQVLGHDLEPDDLRIMYTFAGDQALSEKYEAHSDSDILVLLDCTPDQSMLDEGLAREVNNRIQKLRKAAKLVPSDQVTVYYELKPADHNLQNVINTFQEYIEVTTKSPIRPMTQRTGSESKITSESFSVKGATLNLTITKGFPEGLSNSDGDLTLTDHGMPPSPFVNVVFQGRGGVILLENPKGSNKLTTMNALENEVKTVFGVHGPDIELYLDPSGVGEPLSMLPKTGSTIFAKTKFGTVSKMTSKIDGACCPFVMVENGKSNNVGTLLLENPVSQSVVEHAHQSVKTIFTLKAQPKLFVDSQKKKPITKLSDIANNSTLYV